MIGLFKLEVQAVPGNGKLVRTGVASHTGMRDAVNIAWNYFRANSSQVSGSIGLDTRDYLLHIADQQGVGDPDTLSLALFIALCSAALGKSVQTQAATLGNMTLGGSTAPVEDLASSLQVSLDVGAKRVLVPAANAKDLVTVPPELFVKFQPAFYNDPVDAVFKALDVS